MTKRIIEWLEHIWATIVLIAALIVVSATLSIGWYLGKNIIEIKKDLFIMDQLSKIIKDYDHSQESKKNIK